MNAQAITVNTQDQFEAEIFSPADRQASRDRAVDSIMTTLRNLSPRRRYGLIVRYMRQANHWHSRKRFAIGYQVGMVHNQILARVYVEFPRYYFAALRSVQAQAPAFPTRFVKADHRYTNINGSPAYVSTSIFFGKDWAAYGVDLTPNTLEARAAELAAPEYLLNQAEWVTNSYIVMDAETLKNWHMIRRILRLCQKAGVSLR